MYTEFEKGAKHPNKDADVTDIAELEFMKDAGYLLDENDLIVDIDCLNHEQIKEMIKRLNIKTQTVWTERGVHFYFKKPDGFRGAKSLTALGIEVEYKHLSNTKSVTIKRNGKMRQIDHEGFRESFPEYLKPLRKAKNLLGLDEGEGRNQELFKHRMLINNLENKNTILNYINEVIFAKPMDEKEMENILRDVEVEAVKDGENVIADIIMKEKKVTSYSGELWYYDGTRYQSDTGELIRTVYSYCMNQKTRYVDEVIKQMEYRSKLIKDDKTFDIKLANGILRDGKFIQVDYDEFTPYFIGIPYKSDAPKVDLVEDYLDLLTDGDPDYRLRLLEILGYCLAVDKEFKRMIGKFFIFIGGGGNGKGTLLSIIKSILNPENCGGLSMDNLTDERYLNTLKGKLANLGDDIDNKPIDDKQMKMLKNISTCDFIEMRKLFKNSESVEMTPTMIFTSNHLLKSFEKGESVKRRIEWLPMYGKPKKKDKRFITNITTPEALRYWIKLIVEGYIRLYENQGFTHCEKISEFNRRYHEENNTALEYLQDMTAEDLIGKTSPDAYTPYENWCEENGVNTQSSKLFKETVQQLFELEIRQRKIQGRNMRVFSEK